MIKAITGGPYVNVSGTPFSMPYVDPYNPEAGKVRYNNYQFEVYDGYQWLPAYAGTPNIQLDPAVIAVIDWAMKKMNEEAELQKLAQGKPAVRAAYEAFKRADEQLKTTIILSKDE